MGKRERPLVVAFAQETGQSQVLAPVLKQLLQKGEITLDLFSHRKSAEVWRQNNLPFRPASGCFSTPLSESESISYLHQTRPELVITGASSAVNLSGDLSSLQMSRASRSLGIKNLSLLDNWQGPERFLAAPDDLRPLWAPRYLGVMDEATRKELASLYPETEIAVIGHPHLEQIYLQATGSDYGAIRENLRRDLGIRPDEVVWGVVSQLLHRREPPWQRSSLLALPVGKGSYLDVVTGLVRQQKGRPVLCIKPHPEEPGHDALMRHSDPRLRGLSASTMLQVADHLIGWDSLLLMQGWLGGLGVVSFQPSTDDFSCVRLDQICGVLRATTAQELHDLICSSKSKFELQRRCRWVEQSTSRSVDWVRSILKDIR